MYILYLNYIYIYINYVYTYIFPNKIEIHSSMGPNLGMSIHHGITCKCKQEVSSASTCMHLNEPPPTHLPKYAQILKPRGRIGRTRQAPKASAVALQSNFVDNLRGFRSQNKLKKAQRWSRSSWSGYSYNHDMFINVSKVGRCSSHRWYMEHMGNQQHQHRDVVALLACEQPWHKQVGS